eukprot:6177542-Pleurochrysis_carterae.AAC.3
MGARNETADESAESSKRTQRIHACLKVVPMCGGWCVPTHSPEQNCCLRTVSNENTFFLIAARSYWLRSYIEHSEFCRKAGGLGWHCVERIRVPIMLTALGCSLAAWIFMLGATFGVSYNTYTIKRLSWARVNWRDQRGLVKARKLSSAPATSSVPSQGTAALLVLTFRYDQIRYDPNANVEQSVNWADNDACQVFD